MEKLLDLRCLLSFDMEIVFNHLIIYVLAYYARMYVNIFIPINFILDPFVAHLFDNLYAQQRNFMIKWENVNKFSIASTFDTKAIKTSKQAHASKGYE